MQMKKYLAIFLVFLIFLQLQTHSNIFAVEIAADDYYLNDVTGIGEATTASGDFVKDNDGNYFIAENTTNKVKRINTDGSIDT